MENPNFVKGFLGCVAAYGGVLFLAGASTEGWIMSLMIILGIAWLMLPDDDEAMPA